MYLKDKKIEEDDGEISKTAFMLMHTLHSDKCWIRSFSSSELVFINPSNAHWILLFQMGWGEVKLVQVSEILISAVQKFFKIFSPLKYGPLAISGIFVREFIFGVW